MCGSDCMWILFLVRVSLWIYPIGAVGVVRRKVVERQNLSGSFQGLRGRGGNVKKIMQGCFVVLLSGFSRQRPREQGHP